MPEVGLRERKKRRNRDHIAGAAAELFADRGYENVSVLDVAAAAEVSEQTVYNHFPAKRDLVLDRDADLRDRLVDLVANRPKKTTPAAAIRPAVLELLDALGGLDPAQVRGGLGHLSLTSPEVRRMALEMTDRHADAIAAVLATETDGPPPAVAKARAVALAWVFQTITDESGRGISAGRSPAQIAAGLRPVIERILEDQARAETASRPP